METLPGLEPTFEEELYLHRVEVAQKRLEEAKETYQEQRGKLSALGEEVTPATFYEELFGGRFEQVHGSEWDSERLPEAERRPNGILTELLPYESANGREVRTRIVFEELTELADFVGTERFGFLAPMGYYGRRRRLANAYSMYALAFDLDAPILRLLFGLIEAGSLPRPTWIIQSGTGLHLYYQFTEPIPMFPANVEPLNELKAVLTEAIWNTDTSEIKKVQYQGINQGFRIVGAASKLGADYPVRAYRVGEKFDGLDDLPDKIRNDRLGGLARRAIERVRLTSSTKEWVEPEGGANRQTWHVSRALYDWWKAKAWQASYGHRYFYLMALAIYARKCDVSREELEADMAEVRPLLDSIAEAEGHPLDLMEDRDLEAAMRAYLDPYATFPRASIERLTAIDIPPNRRNYRTQTEHLKIARATRDIMGRNTGRPPGSGTKEALVRSYLEAHPDETPTQVARALGVSRPTVYKYRS